MLEKYLLVKFNPNWADEINFESFIVFTESAWNKFKEDVGEYFKNNLELCYYVGTNEELIYNSAKELLQNFKCEEILSEEEYRVLNKLFSKSGDNYYSDIAFGNPVIEILDYINERKNGEDENE